MVEVVNAKMNEIVARAYQILHLTEGASTEDVKAAYAALRTNAGGGGQDGWSKVKEIEWAFDILENYLTPEKQVEQFDRTLDRCGEKCTILGHLKQHIFPGEEKAEPVCLWGRGFFFLIMLFWGLKFIFAPLQGAYIGSSFMHLINLPFHEAGHLVFSLLGEFMTILGGTLMQILIPGVCLVAFVRRGDMFGGSFALWWVGQSFIDAAPYIYDARAGQLMLLGGLTGQDAPDYHDWHNMLARLGLLSYDHALGYLAKYAGAFLILCSLASAAFALFSQYRSLRNSR